MVQVWDRVVRFIHWSVALLVAVNFLNEEGESWHRYGGYLIAGLVLLRLCWGISSKGEAGFSRWPLRLADLAAYLRSIAAGRNRHYLGLNPPGALMAIAIWALLLALGITGWMMGLDAWWGEEWLQELHALLANILLACISAHIIAVVLVSFIQKENLPKSMLTGRKRQP